MSLVNSDENKTFGVVLRTPVENSKGIPHILEHSVLCGSRKYPIKVPPTDATVTDFCLQGREPASRLLPSVFDCALRAASRLLPAVFDCAL